MLIFINLIYYHLSLNECYLKGPNASFDLGEKKREREEIVTCVFGNDILTAGSEYSIRSFLYSRVNPLTEKKEILWGGMRNCAFPVNWRRSAGSVS